MLEGKYYSEYISVFVDNLYIGNRYLGLKVT